MTFAGIIHTWDLARPCGADDTPDAGLAAWIDDHLADILHTCDLARACGADDTLDAGLVAWIDDHLADIHAGLAETPVDPTSRHLFFAAPGGEAGPSRQDRLLHRMGRRLGADGGDQR